MLHHLNVMFQIVLNAKLVLPQFVVHVMLTSTNYHQDNVLIALLLTLKFLLLMEQELVFYVQLITVKFVQMEILVLNVLLVIIGKQILMNVPHVLYQDISFKEITVFYKQILVLYQTAKNVLEINVPNVVLTIIFYQMGNVLYAQHQTLKMAYLMELEPVLHQFLMNVISTVEFAKIMFA